MAGIFPYSQDGGLPPNPGQPNNPAQAFDPLIPPQDTSALYYGNGCNVRLRPAVVNSLISEIAATADRAGLPYRAASLQNLELAVRYLIQRGLPRGALLVETNPFNFIVTLDPPPKAYTDFMTLTLVPQMLGMEIQNQGYVRINVNGLGFVPLYRNDGQELRAADLRAGKPFIVAYYQGAFYVVGLSNSQVPLVLVGAVDFWVRPDGHDDTGDGTTNTPDKAFRTIAGCWNAVGSRYAGSPTAEIRIRLGIPGDYESANIGPYGATVTVYGDPNNPAGYRIIGQLIMVQGIAGACWSLRLQQINNANVIGVTLVVTYGGTTVNGVQALRIASGNCTLQWVRCSIEVESPDCEVVLVEGGGSMIGIYDNYFIGNGHSVRDGWAVTVGSRAGGDPLPNYLTWHWSDIHFNDSGYAISDRSAMAFWDTTVQLTNTTGKRYTVSGLSNLFPNTQPIPGDQPGTTDTGGQVV